VRVRAYISNSHWGIGKLCAVSWVVLKVNINRGDAILASSQYSMLIINNSTQKFVPVILSEFYILISGQYFDYSVHFEPCSAMTCM